MLQAASGKGVRVDTSSKNVDNSLRDLLFTSLLSQGAETIDDVEQLILYDKR